MERTLLRAALIPAALLFSACASELPAPAAPAREVPAVHTDMTVIAPQRQWLILDTPGDRAQVYKLTGTTGLTTASGTTYVGDTEKMLCITPCAADVHVGEQRLHFESLEHPEGVDDVKVQLDKDPVVVRHILEQRPITSAGWATGITMIVLGVVGGGLAGGTMAATGGDLQVPGYVTLASGGAVAIVGLILAFVYRGEHRAGATTVWTLPLHGPSPAGGLP